MEANFVYSYDCKLSAANLNATLDFTGKEAIIRTAIDSFNLKGARMANPKTLLLKGIAHEHIIVQLQSSLPLNTPGRALKTLSAIFIKEIRDPDFIAALTPGGQLFRCTSLLPESEREPPVEGLSDLDAIKALLDYVMTKKDAKFASSTKRRRAFEKIKRIIIDDLLK